MDLRRKTLVSLALLLVAPPLWAGELMRESFTYPDGLISNEYAYWNPGDPSAVNSPVWELTSGSMFAQGNQGWTGIPDDKAPNATSSNGTNSAVFRLTTKRADFGDVAVSFSLLNQGLSTSPSTPAVAWDGVHIFLRYQTEYNLYYASINRRDNTVIIKKKIPGGPSNGGTYYDMCSSGRYTVPYNTWQSVRATIKTNADQSVTIQLFAGATLLVTAVDNGTIGGPPILNPGKVGIRGDNANLKFDDFVVTTLDAPPPPLPPPSNAPPTVNAGTDQTLTYGDAVKLSGTASDDGMPNPPASLTYRWTQVGGPQGATFSAPGALRSSVQCPSAGTYTFRLTANDSALSASDDIQITLNAPPAPPPDPTPTPSPTPAPTPVPPAPKTITSDATPVRYDPVLNRSAGERQIFLYCESGSPVIATRFGEVIRGSLPETTTNTYAWDGATDSGSTPATGMYVEECGRKRSAVVFIR